MISDGVALKVAMLGEPEQLDFDEAGFTVTVTCLVTAPPQPVAVNVYVVVLSGLTTSELGVATPPMP